ncbi:MAG: HAD family hydrolase [Candidatus Helarchaeota archaeon]|nr:HAD family hydrolase [Candidatus Helarchaeota archaeon]
MVLIFDLDGTLIHSTFFSEVLMEKLFQKLEKNNISVQKPVIFQEILKRFLGKLAAEDKTPAYDWDLIMCEYLAQYQLSWKCEIEDYYKSDEIAKHSFLFKDVGGVLTWLSEKNYKMVILTNGLHKYQDNVIIKLDLQKFFEKIVMPDPNLFNFVKPNPEIFKFATEGFPEPHISIGDSLYFDVFGAKGAGFKAIWLMRRLPKKYAELPPSERTAKINQNHPFLLKYIIESAPFLKASAPQLNLELFKPDTVIANLNELKEIL